MEPGAFPLERAFYPVSQLTGEGYWDEIVNSALCKLFVLSALQETPMHGYALTEKGREALKSGLDVWEKKAIPHLVRVLRRSMK